MIRSNRIRPLGQRGFTLIELIVVLVILGILAAFAIPRFAGVNEDARKAALQGLSGSLRSSSALVHGLALARGKASQASGETVTLEGVDVDLIYGYPAATAAGIGSSVLNLDGFTQTIGTGTVTYTTTNAPANPATCSVTYTQPTSASTAGVVTSDLTDCS